MIVEFVGIMKPSYVEFDGLIPASSGVDDGPCQVETPAAAQGESSIRVTRTRACLIGFTEVNPAFKGLNLRFS